MVQLVAASFSRNPRQTATAGAGRRPGPAVSTEAAAGMQPHAVPGRQTQVADPGFGTASVLHAADRRLPTGQPAGQGAHAVSHAAAVSSGPCRPRRPHAAALTPPRSRPYAGVQGCRGYGMRKGERYRKGVRGCIISRHISVLHLVIVKKGPAEIPGLTDESIPCAMITIY